MSEFEEYAGLFAGNGDFDGSGALDAADVDQKVRVSEKLATDALHPERHSNFEPTRGDCKCLGRRDGQLRL